MLCVLDQSSSEGGCECSAIKVGLPMGHSSQTSTQCSRRHAAPGTCCALSRVSTGFCVTVRWVPGSLRPAQPPLLCMSHSGPASSAVASKLSSQHSFKRLWTSSQVTLTVPVLLQVTVQMSRARNDLEASRADNIALVERLKYVQGYQSAGRSRKGVFLTAVGQQVCAGLPDSGVLQGRCTAACCTQNFPAGSPGAVCRAVHACQFKTLQLAAAILHVRLAPSFTACHILRMSQGVPGSYGGLPARLLVLFGWCP